MLRLRQFASLQRMADIVTTFPGARAVALNDAIASARVMPHNIEAEQAFL
jgi:hypothetical protein